MKVKKSTNPFLNFGTIFILSLIVLLIGILGFYIYEEKNWYTALYNASTTMTTVGTAIIPNNDSAKIFSSIYALFSGLFFLYILAFFVAVWVKSCGDIFEDDSDSDLNNNT